MQRSTRKAAPWLAAAAIAAAAAGATVMSATAETGPKKQSSEGVATASINCAHTYTNSSGVAKFTSCISEHGNVMQMELGGNEFLRVGDFREGYAVCDRTSGQNYYDVGSSEAGWGPSVTKVSGLSFFVTRTTNDGIWTLNQGFFFNGFDREVRIVERLTNNSRVRREALFSRYNDTDADNDVGDDVADRSINSTWIREAGDDTAGGRGQALSLNSLSPRNPRASVIEFFPGTGEDCSVGGLAEADLPTPRSQRSDYTGKLIHAMPTFAAGATKLLTYQYKIQ